MTPNRRGHMASYIRRRKCLATLDGAAAARQLAARARHPVIGFLDAGSAAERAQQVAAFRKGLAEAGYQEGQNVALEFRWAEGQYGRFAELAADLVRRRVSVIVTPGSPAAALAAKAATTTRSCSARAGTLSSKGWSPASIDLAAMPPASTSSAWNWWPNACSCCVSWCRQRNGSPCWSIPPIRRAFRFRST